MGAKIANPRKQFQFNVIIPGLNPFLVQKIKSPDMEFEVAEHGDTNFVVKTAGIRKVGSLTLEKISSATGIDAFMSVWFNQIGNTATGGGLPPSAYKKTIVIEQLGNDNVSVIQTWVIKGAWPQKRNGIDFDRKGNDNSMETIEFACDEVDDGF